MAAFIDRRDFDYKIYIVLLIFYTACSMFMPIFMTSGRQKLVHYTNEWVLVQVGCNLKD
jgi:hypothetical protein